MKNIFKSTLIIIGMLISSSQLMFAQNNDSLYLNKESLHFNLYSTKGDISVLDTLAFILEDNYERITNNLGTQIDKKIKVSIYPSVKAFHEAQNLVDVPEWVVGFGSDDELKMVSPMNPGNMHTYESLMQVIIHEFVHAAQLAVRGGGEFEGVPKWMTEGHAYYEAGQINQYIHEDVKKHLLAKTLPSWSQLEEVSDFEFGNIGGYSFSANIVEYLIEKYGYEKFVSIFKQPTEFEKIYGVSKDAMEIQWLQYLEKTYLN